MSTAAGGVIASVGQADVDTFDIVSQAAGARTALARHPFGVGE